MFVIRPQHYSIRFFSLMIMLIAVLMFSGCTAENTNSPTGQATGEGGINPSASIANAEVKGIIRPVTYCQGLPEWINGELCAKIEYVIISQDSTIKYIDPLEEGSRYLEYDVYSVRGNPKKISAMVCDCEEKGTGFSTKIIEDCESEGNVCVPGTTTTQNFQYIELTEPMIKINR